MSQRGKGADRCPRCRVHAGSCLCPELPRLRLVTRVVLAIHERELHKPTATGPLAAAALVNSQLYIHGRRGAPLDLRHLHDERRRVLILFPSAGAGVLDGSFSEDGRPVTLVVPDGNWSQAARIPKRVPGLRGVEHVRLPSGPPSRWGVRKLTRPAGVATLEAIARALGILESPAAQRQLERLLDRAAAATMRARGRRPTP